MPEWIAGVFAALCGMCGLVMWAAGRLSEREARRIEEATEAEEAAERPLTVDQARELARIELSEREIAWAGGRQPMLDAMRAAKARAAEAGKPAPAEGSPGRIWSGFDPARGPDYSAEYLVTEDGSIQPLPSLPDDCQITFTRGRRPGAE